MKITNLLYFSVRCMIGVIFIYAGTVKLFDPKVFTQLIDAYGVVPDTFLMSAAITLPLLEIIAGTGLIFDIRGSLSTVTVLLILFTAVLGYGISMGLDIDCGCFGAGDPEAKAYHGLRSTLYRDIAMLAAGLYLFTWRRIKNVKTLSLLSCLKNIYKRRI